MDRNQLGLGSRLTLGGHSSAAETGNVGESSILAALMQPPGTRTTLTAFFFGDCSLILPRIVLLGQCSLVFTHRLIHVMLTSIELDKFVEY